MPPKMLKLKVKLDDFAIQPSRAYPTDAGLDLMSPIDIRVNACSNVTIDTGVHVEIPQGWAGILKSKSGLNIKHNLINSGVIDCGYTGSIKVQMHNLDVYRDYQIHRGDKITQLLLVPVWTPEIDFVDEIDGGERGDNGFGSTGK